MPTPKKQTLSTKKEILHKRKLEVENAESLEEFLKKARIVWLKNVD